MENDGNDSGYWMERARKMRADAGGSDDASVQRAMDKIAGECKKMAEFVRKRPEIGDASYSEWRCQVLDSIPI
jgi:hypothetical protein